MEREYWFWQLRYWLLTGFVLSVVSLGGCLVLILGSKFYAQAKDSNSDNFVSKKQEQITQGKEQKTDLFTFSPNLFRQQKKAPTTISDNKVLDNEQNQDLKISNQANYILHSKYRFKSFKFRSKQEPKSIQQTTINKIRSKNSDKQEIIEAPELETQEQSGLELTLSDVVFLAIQNNREIKNAYLQRIIDRQDLAVTEDEFVPNFTPTISVSIDRNNTNGNTIGTRQLNAGITFAVKIPTGANFQVEWTGLRRLQDINSLGSNENILGQNLELSINQPLMRGRGIDVNTAPVKIARLTEDINIFALKSTLISTITEAIQAYRNLLQSQERVKIEQLSLISAQRQFEVLKALIEAGRRARVELVQSEADIANRQVSLLAARNTLEQSRLDLIQVLDIEQEIPIIASEIPKLGTKTELNDEQLQQLALVNNPDYLQSFKQVEISQLNLLLSEDRKRWGLDFNVGYNLNNTGADDRDNWRAGLTLSREFGNLELEQGVERSQVNLRRDQNELEEAEESLKIDLENRIRDVRFNFQQVELARRARELAEQQLANEREKLKLGVEGARIIDIVDFENDLVRAKNTELNAIIDYLNSLTRLEETVGITLDSWNVEIEADARKKD